MVVALRRGWRVGGDGALGVTGGARATGLTPLARVSEGGEAAPVRASKPLFSATEKIVAGKESPGVLAGPRQIQGLRGRFEGCRGVFSRDPAGPGPVQSRSGRRGGLPEVAMRREGWPLCAARAARARLELAGHPQAGILNVGSCSFTQRMKLPVVSQGSGPTGVPSQAPKAAMTR